jgi:primosomal protein N'
MKFVEVIPLLRLPRSLEVFDYTVPLDLQDEICIGSVVEIPFRRRNVIGIVAAQKNLSKYARIPIKKLLDREPLIDAATLTLFRLLSHEAFVTPGLFLRHVLPEVPKRMTITPLEKILSAPEVVPDETSAFLQKITTEDHTQVRVDDASRTRAILSLFLAEAYEKNSPLLILFPIQEHAAAYVQYLKTKNIPAALTLPTDSKNKVYALWRAFQARKQLVVVGTRNALFFPMSRGGRYVLIDEVAEEWKQSEINPRIDARTILPRLAAHFKARTCILTPQCTLRTNTTNQEILDRRVHPNPSTTVAKSTAASLFSSALIEAMREKKRVLFFVHRKGTAALLRCKDCSYTASCPVCHLALAVGNNFLRCTACEAHTDMILTCPKCAGAELITYGTGTEAVRAAAKALFPDTEITVTTSALLNQWPITEETPPFDLVAIVEADTILHRPDFRSQEKLARLVNRLRQIAAKNNAPFIIQTQLPDLLVWLVGSEHEKQWIDTELQERKNLHQPPFWRMVKLLFQDQSEQEVKKQAEKVYQALEGSLPKTIELVGPYPATPPKIRNNYYEIILLRFQPEELAIITPELSSLPDTIIVDLDPSDVLR